MSRRYVALLRGVNVGRANRVAMADLRRVVASLGYTTIRTVLNSGNVVFSGPGEEPAVIAERIREALAAECDVRVRATVLSAEEFAAVVRGYPLPEVAPDATRLLVGFVSGPAEIASLGPLSQREWRPEAVGLGERAVYAWCPEGVTASPLLAAVGGLLGDRVTFRNWATVIKVQGALDDAGPVAG